MVTHTIANTKKHKSIGLQCVSLFWPIARPMRQLIAINDIFHIIYGKAFGVFRPIRASEVNF